MLIFQRARGVICHEDGTVMLTGIWAGHGPHANKPEDQALHGLGPLPAGDYTVAHPRDGGHLGPFVMDLVQVSGETFGRSLFRIHGAAGGDTTHQSSDGCVIASHDGRVAIDKALGTDHRILRVV